MSYWLAAFLGFNPFFGGGPGGAGVNLIQGQQLAQLLSLSRLLGGFSNTISVDAAGRFAEYRTNLAVPIISKIVTALTAIRAAGPQPPAGGQEILPGSVGLPPQFTVRGPYLGACVAQALRDAGTRPPQPTNPPAIFGPGIPGATPGSLKEQFA